MEKQELSIENIIEKIENNELTVDAGLLYTNFLILEKLDIIIKLLTKKGN